MQMFMFEQGECRNRNMNIKGKWNNNQDMCHPCLMIVAVSALDSVIHI